MRFSVDNKQIIKLAAPISLSLFVPQVSFMANAIFLGRLGQLELVANGLASIFYLLLTYIGFGLSNGVMVLLSRRAGEGDPIGLARTLGNGLLLGCIASLLLACASMVFAPLLFGRSLDNPEIFHATVGYLNQRIWGLPFLLLGQLANAFYISTNRSKWLIWGALLGNCVTVTLDYVLIFGKAGFPDMGLRGAAVASVTGEAVAFSTLLLLFFANRLHLKYPVLQYFRLDVRSSLQTLKISSPLILQYVFSIGGWQLFYIYVEHLGRGELAASHILRSVLGVFSIGTWALASTCNTMVSNLIGQNKSTRVFVLVKKVVSISFGYTFVVASFLFLFPSLFLSLYSKDPEVIRLGIPALRVLSVSSLVMSMATVFFNAVVGTGRTTVNLCIEVFCVSMYTIYVIIFVGHYRCSLPYAWASEFVYWGCLLVASTLYLYRGNWKRSGI